MLLKEVFTHIICSHAQFLLMTQIFKVCQIDHRFEHFGHLFMLLTIAAKDSHSDLIRIYERQSETDELSF